VAKTGGPSVGGRVGCEIEGGGRQVACTASRACRLVERSNGYQDIPVPPARPQNCGFRLQIAVARG